MGADPSTLFREGFSNDKFAVRLLFIQRWKSDACFAAFPVFHSSKAQADPLLIYDEPFIHIFVAAEEQILSFIASEINNRKFCRNVLTYQ